METITNFIQQVGFPIAAFFLIWWDSRTTGKQNVEAIQQMKSAVEDNTVVTGKMFDLLSSLDKRDDL